MNEVNSFWKKGRIRQEFVRGESVTIPGMSCSVAQLVETGDIDSVSERVRKSMLFGRKVRLEDLTAFDYFRDKVEIYNNLFKRLKKDEQRVYDERVNNEEASKEEVDSPKVVSIKKAVNQT